MWDVSPVAAFMMGLAAPLRSWGFLQAPQIVVLVLKSDSDAVCSSHVEGPEALSSEWRLVQM